MEELFWTRPDLAYGAQIREYRQEFLDAGAYMDGCGLLRKYEDPAQYIQVSLERENPETTPAGMTPAIQLHFIRKADQTLVGMVQIRHCTNAYIEQYTGHLGYCVRPSQRRKGYAKEMLRMTLMICRELGMEKVLVCCADDNIASEKTILANGGVYESTVHEPNAHVDLKRFWIQL